MNRPRVNLTRYHGVFAPNSTLRQQVTPARRGRQDNEPRTSAQRYAAMGWAQRFKRVFKIYIEPNIGVAVRHCAYIGKRTLKTQVFSCAESRFMTGY